MKRLFVTTFVALAATAGVAFAETESGPTVHEVQMLNKSSDNPRETMVYEPAVLVIQPGDTVKFLSTAKGHNAQSAKGMAPEGAEKFKTRLNQDAEVTFDVPGVYGIQCLPHYAAGMVGLIVVEGEGWDANLEEAKEARHRGKAKKRMAEYFEQLDEMMADQTAMN